MFGSRYLSALALAALIMAWSVPSFAVHPSAEARWRNPYCPDGVCTTKDPFGYWPTKWGRWPGAAKEEKRAQDDVERRAIVKPKGPIPTPTTATDTETETRPTERPSTTPGEDENPFKRFLEPNPTPKADGQLPMNEPLPMDETSPMREPASIPEDSTAPIENGQVPIPDAGPTLEQDQDDQSNPFLPNDEDTEKNKDKKDGASSSRRQKSHLNASVGAPFARQPRRLPDSARVSKPIAPHFDGRRYAGSTPSREAESARNRATLIASETDSCNPLRRDLEGPPAFERAPAPGRQQTQRSAPSRMLADLTTSNPLRLASVTEPEQSYKEACYEDNSPSQTVNPLRSR